MRDSRTLRLLDVLCASLGLIVGSPLIGVLWLVTFFGTRAPIFRQVRVGRQQRPFVLYKFRTMREGTPSVGTHLTDPTAVTRWGAFLRRSKLDELPQLWNVLKGEMSMVGPRPCLPNQTELIAEREKRGLFAVRPGVTGLAQIQGIDMSDPVRLAEVDAHMVRSLDLVHYFRYLAATVLGGGRGDRVRT